MKKRFFGIEDLSEYLGISKNTLYSWVNQRKIPHYKIYGSVRFDFEELTTWLKERKVEVSGKV